MWSVRTYYSLLLCLLVILQDSHYVIATVRPSTVKADPLSSSKPKESEWKLMDIALSIFNNHLLDETKEEHIIRNRQKRGIRDFFKKLKRFSPLGSIIDATRRKARGDQHAFEELEHFVPFIPCNTLCKLRKEYNDKVSVVSGLQDEAEEKIDEWGQLKNLTDDIATKHEQIFELVKEADYISDKTIDVIRELILYFSQNVENPTDMDVLIRRIASFLDLNPESYETLNPEEELHKLLTMGIDFKKLGKFGKFTQRVSRSLRIKEVDYVLGHLAIWVMGITQDPESGRRERAELRESISELDAFKPKLTKEISELCEDLNTMNTIIDNRTKTFRFILDQTLTIEDFISYHPHTVKEAYNELKRLENTPTNSHNILKQQDSLIEFLIETTEELNKIYNLIKQKSLIAIDVDQNLSVYTMIGRFRTVQININAFTIYRLISQMFPNMTDYDGVYLDCIRQGKIVDNSELDTYLNTSSTKMLGTVAKRLVEELAQTQSNLNIIKSILATIDVIATDYDILRVIAHSKDKALKDLSEYCPNAKPCIQLEPYKQVIC